MCGTKLVGAARVVRQWMPACISECLPLGPPTHLSYTVFGTMLTLCLDGTAAVPLYVACFQR